MHHLLILACSQVKLPKPALLPALERYDGPLWRLLRKRGGHLIDSGALTVYALSARYGLVNARTTLISTYDQRMTPERAHELRPSVRATLAALWPRGQVCLHVGRAYLGAISDTPAHWPRALTGYGGIGMRQAQLKAWLEGL